MGSFTVRRWRPADEPAVLDVLASLAGQRYPGPLAGPNRQTMRAWLHAGGHPLARWVSLDASGTVTGHVAVRSADAAMLAGVSWDSGGSPFDRPRLPVMEVTRLFTAAPVWGTHTGRALLDQATGWVASVSAHGILYVSDYLRDAISLYERSDAWRRAGWAQSALNADRLVVYAAPALDG